MIGQGPLLSYQQNVWIVDAQYGGNISIGENGDIQYAGSQSIYVKIASITELTKIRGYRMSKSKSKDIYSGEHINAWTDEDGWLSLDFMCNMTTLVIPVDFKDEVIEDLKKLVKSMGK